MAVKKSAAVSMMGMCMWTCRMCWAFCASEADLLSDHDENRRAA